MSEKLICDRIAELIDPEKYRLGGLEYGASESWSFGNHLYRFEMMNWRILCLQPDEDKFTNLRILRRLSKLINCEKDNGNTIDGFLEKTNVPQIKILLIKETESPSTVLKGFSPERWETEIISVQYLNKEDRSQSEKILFGNGFVHYETVSVAEIYIKPLCELTNIEPPKKKDINQIFEV